MKSVIRFADERVKESLNKLKESTTEDKKLYETINKVLDNLEEDAFAGIQIQKRLIPEVYKTKYGVTNVWKCDLQNGWRLLYTVGKEDVIVLSIILEWMNHKDYERRFGY